MYWNLTSSVHGIEYLKLSVHCIEYLIPSVQGIEYLIPLVQVIEYLIPSVKVIEYLKPSILRIEYFQSKVEIDPAMQRDAGYYECQAHNKHAVDVKVNIVVYSTVQYNTQVVDIF